MEILLILALVAALLALDTTHAFQIMISQPIFACPILGLIAGQFHLGLMIGIIFELLFLNVLPVGGNQFPEGNMGAMSGLIFLITAIESGSLNWEAILPLAILLGILNSYAGMLFTSWHRKHNEKYVEILNKSLNRNKNIPATLRILLIRAMGHYVVFSMILIIASTQLFYHAVKYLQMYVPYDLPTVNIHFWIFLFLIYGLMRMIPFKIGKEKKK